ncbi:MAG: tetratricopeptide repeat protein [Bacteroidales bacterium]
MRRVLFLIIIWAAFCCLVACASTDNKNTIASLRDRRIEIKEEKIEGGLEKAMASYQRFVEESPESALKPEAIRRLADLKLEKEYGTLTPGAESKEQAAALAVPEIPWIDSSMAATSKSQVLKNIHVHDESEADFEKRTTQMQKMESAKAFDETLVEAPADLERAGAREAIALYRKLLKDYPRYERNDQVLYQMSRAYEELGQVEEAMEVMNRMVTAVPQSRYIDEVQFRRAEYFFVRKRYLDAEEAYLRIVNMGVGSSFYELALYKLGWTFYKQELCEDALHRFIALLDHKVSVGYDFEQTEDEQEQKRTDDTFRVVSLSFSSIGAADAVVEYFSRHGKRVYEDKVYGNLGEFYFDKRRYADAAATYEAFVTRNPFHKVAPSYHMRVIEIQATGGFPSLVLESKKKFATTYGLKAEYWKYFDPSDRLDVLDLLKTNLTDLTNHYHACYQNPRQAKEKVANFKEALHWYREYLTSFPKDTESPVMNFQLANLLVENKWFESAAVEFEKTAYEYPAHEKSSESGYAAVAAYREQLKIAGSDRKDTVRRNTVRSSIKFADTFPKHEKAAIILGAAVDDLYGMKEFEQALHAAKKLIKVFPNTDIEVIRDAWVVMGHSAYELSSYSEAEGAYSSVLKLLPKEDKKRDALIDNLAASIYKQGEQANAAQDYRVAAEDFLRVSSMAPTSKIRPTAEYDAATALIQLKDWEMAAKVLVGFRNNFPENPLQHEVTKKLAYVYRENNQYSFAANEYERIEKESKDDEIRGEALLIAAELHEKDNNRVRALDVYRRYVSYFPHPVELNLETRSKIAEILRAENDYESYLKELKDIVDIDASAGNERSERTRYLAAEALLVLAEKEYETFAAVKLVKPFEENLKKKRKLMQTATTKFNRLLNYEIGKTTAAATYYLAEIYAHFSNALMTSERPEGLNPLEMEQYELAIEEQAYPFEERAIQVHESNIKLISLGVYNKWIDKSLQKLAVSMPAHYDKPEEASGVISSLDTFVYEIDRPAPVKVEPTPAVVQPEEDEAIAEQKPEETAQFDGSVPVTEPETAKFVQDEGVEAVLEPETAEPIQDEEVDTVTASETAESVQDEEVEAVTEPESAEPAQDEGVQGVTEPESEEPAQDEGVQGVTEPESEEPAQDEGVEAVTEPESVEPVQDEGVEAVTELESEEPAQDEGVEAVTEPESEEPAQDEGVENVTEPFQDDQMKYQS